MSPAWSMLIQCGAVNDSPSNANCCKGGVRIVPGGWNTVRLPSGDLTKPPVFSALQLVVSPTYQPAIIPPALMPSGIVSWKQYTG